MDYRVLLFAFKASAQWIASCGHQSSKCHHFFNIYLLIPYCVLNSASPSPPVFIFLSIGCCLHFCFCSFLHFSYLPFLLLFASLLCLLKSQSTENRSYSKILINWRHIYIHIFYLSFACFHLEFLFSRSFKDPVSKQYKGRETGTVESIPLFEKLEERSSVLFNLWCRLPQIGEYDVEQGWVVWPMDQIWLTTCFCQPRKLRMVFILTHFFKKRMIWKLYGTQILVFINYTFLEHSHVSLCMCSLWLLLHSIQWL